MTGVPGDDWVGTLKTTLADFGISPVENPQMGFSNATKGEGEDAEQRYLCPGTPITFTQYSFAQRMQYEMTIPNYRLPGSVSNF